MKGRPSHARSDAMGASIGGSLYRRTKQKDTVSLSTGPSIPARMKYAHSGHAVVHTGRTYDRRLETAMSSADPVLVIACERPREPR